MLPVDQHMRLPSLNAQFVCRLCGSAGKPAACVIGANFWMVYPARSR